MIILTKKPAGLAHISRRTLAISLASLACLSVPAIAQNTTTTTTTTAPANTTAPATTPAVPANTTATPAAPANTTTPAAPANTTATPAAPANATAAPADATAAAAPAGSGTPVTYTASQGRQGSNVYRDNCASCHGDSLQGALDAPTLVGPTFQANWFGQPVSNLYTFIAQYMPQDRPGALTPTEYANVTAFILSKNGVAATDAELPSDAAAQATLMLPPPAAQ